MSAAPQSPQPQPSRSSAPATPATHGQRRLLIGLAVLFFAPLGLSFYLYYGHSSLQPGKHVNHGDLIEPPRPLPALALPLLESGMTDPQLLRQKWTLLYAGAGACGEACRIRLYDTRQVRTALDRDMTRVQRVFIAPEGCCDPQFLHDQHPDLITVRATGAAPLLALLPAADRVYVVDPLGNLILSYAADAPPKGLLTDLKRLLKLSHIG